MTTSRRRLLASAIALPLAAWIAPLACAQSDRCTHCGMRIDPSSPFRAGATAGSGAAVSFDTPKCLFRWLLGPSGADAREPWALDYYRRERRDAAVLFFVVGSDVLGPMGHDLVPVEGRARADRFATDHRGTRVLAFAEVTLAVVEPLFGGGGHHH